MLLARCVLALVPMVLAGCVHALSDPTAFNLRLEPPASGAPGQPPASCLTVTQHTETCLLPGMKLVVDQTDARVNTSQDRTIVASRNEWIIPSVDTFGQEDLFQLSWLLSVSQIDGVVDVPAGVVPDASRCYEGWLTPKLYPAQFKSDFLAPLLGSLRVQFRVPVDGASPATADKVKGWMRALPALHKAGSQEIYERNALLFELPLLPATAVPASGTPEYCKRTAATSYPFIALQGGSPFERETTDKTTFAHPGGWYRQNPPILESRTYVGIMVPITARPSDGIRYVPMDASLTEAAQSLRGSDDGLVGVWRDARLAPQGLDRDYERCADTRTSRIFLRAVDSETATCARGEFPVRRETFKQILVAPHDELQFGTPD